MIFSIANIYSRTHFYLGNVYRFFTAVIYQKKIYPGEACSIFGASFAADGWHHIRKTLQEYDTNPDINYKDTSMYIFLKYFTPIGINDLIKNGSKGQCALPLFVYPWGTFKKNEIVSNKDPLLSRFCGPSSDFFIKDEFERTILLYKKIKKAGYKPWLYGNTFIGGTLLINKNGERRFVVLQGNHRMAILAHLGYKNIAVRDVKGYLVEISESQMMDWYLVKAGLCPKNIAERVFDIFYKQNGNHISNLLHKKD